MRRLAQIFSILLIAPFLQADAVCGARPATGSLEMQQVVDHYIVDYPLHLRWAVTVDCAHPERPWRTVAVAWQEPEGVHAVASQPILPPALVVKAGSRVEVWRIADNSMVQLHGTAVDSGAEGQVVHVRLFQSMTVLMGKVRGVGSVELTGSGKWEAQ